MSSPIKVAAVQAAPAFMDRRAGAEKAVALIDEAGAKGVQLIVFPELWLPGYPWFLWLGSPAWCMQFIGRYNESSLEAGCEEDLMIAEAARRNNIQVVLGLSEKLGGSLYISQWHYGADGKMIDRRRKLKPTHVERTLFGESDGSHINVNDTELGRVGSLCCWEHLQPLVKYAMFSQNEQIHCAAWPSFTLYLGAAHALSGEMNMAVSQVYAAEGQCFVIAASALCSQEMCDMLCDTPDKQALLQTGGGYSRIFGPDGQSVVEPLPADQEGLLIADIDLSMIAYAKNAADPVGHYARPDVFKLMFNDSPHMVVEDFGVKNTRVLSSREEPEPLPSEEEDA